MTRYLTTEEAANAAYRMAGRAQEMGELNSVNATAMRILMPFAMIGRIPRDDEVERVLSSFVPETLSKDVPEYKDAVRRVVDDVLALAEDLKSKNTRE
jgi:hypothetical protein